MTQTWEIRMTQLKDRFTIKELGVAYLYSFPSLDINDFSCLFGRWTTSAFQAEPREYPNVTVNKYKEFKQNWSISCNNHSIVLKFWDTIPITGGSLNTVHNNIW